MLEAILLEADKLKIDASPDKMNQSKREIRRNNDYTSNDEEEVESDDSNQIPEDEDGNTDYTANVPEDDEADQNKGNDADNQEDQTTEEEPQEEPSEDTQDDQSEETPEEQPETDEGGTEEEPPADDEDPNPDEGTDYTDMDGEDADNAAMGDEGSDDMGDEGGGDDTMSDDSGGESQTETPEQINERHNKIKQLTLMKQMINLHDNINTYINQITNIERNNIISSSILSVVIDNFNKLKDVVYKYILYYFDHMSYQYNLYTFNYLMEALKMNVELLAKVNDAQNAEIDNK